jgi:hypothetical protein
MLVSDVQDVSQTEKAVSKAGIGADLLTRHGDFLQPRETYFATYNQLTFPAERHVEEQRTTAYTWSDRNQHNATVPHNIQSLRLTMNKMTQQHREQAQSPFDTTARVSLAVCMIIAQSS